MKTIDNIHEWIIKKSFIYQVLFFFIVSYFFTLLLLPLKLNVPVDSGRDYSVLWSSGRNSFIFSVIIVAPLIESFVFQWLIYEQLNAYNFFRKRIYLIIQISGAIFGLIHYYSVVYQILAFGMGCYLCFIYHYFLKYSKYAFLAIVIIHALRNLVAIIFKLS